MQISRARCILLCLTTTDTKTRSAVSASAASLDVAAKEYRNLVVAEIEAGDAGPLDLDEAVELSALIA